MTAGTGNGCSDLDNDLQATNDLERRSPGHMRRRTRIQPYVSAETQRKLRAYADAHTLSESAVAEAAILEFVDHGGLDEDLVLRRLDAVSQGLAQLQHDTDITSHALAFLARYAFLAAPKAPAPEAQRNAESLYDIFLDSIARRLQAGTRMEHEIRRAAARKAATPGQAPQGGR